MKTNPSLTDTFSWISLVLLSLSLNSKLASAGSSTSSVGSTQVKPPAKSESEPISPKPKEDSHIINKTTPTLDAIKEYNRVWGAVQCVGSPQSDYIPSRVRFTEPSADIIAQAKQETLTIKLKTIQDQLHQYNETHEYLRLNASGIPLLTQTSKDPAAAYHPHTQARDQREKEKAFAHAHPGLNTKPTPPTMINPAQALEQAQHRAQENKLNIEAYNREALAPQEKERLATTLLMSIEITQELENLYKSYNEILTEAQRVGRDQKRYRNLLYSLGNWTEAYNTIFSYLKIREMADPEISNLKGPPWTYFREQVSYKKEKQKIKKFIKSFNR